LFLKGILQLSSHSAGLPIQTPLGKPGQSEGIEIERRDAIENQTRNDLPYGGRQREAVTVESGDQGPCPTLPPLNKPWSAKLPPDRGSELAAVLHLVPCPTQLKFRKTTPCKVVSQWHDASGDAKTFDTQINVRILCRECRRARNVDVKPASSAANSDNVAIITSLRIEALIIDSRISSTSQRRRG
jgi:hypothetical protein